MKSKNAKRGSTSNIQYKKVDKGLVGILSRAATEPI